MSKHTPGPWVTEKRPGDEWWFGGKDGAEIVLRPKHGEPWSSIAVVGASLSSDGVGDTNARLIAAAPELLEALVAASNYIDTLGGVSKSYRQLIAKATGE